MNINELIGKATSAMSNSYCPYSKYPVGAALLTADEKVYIGVNVENSSYGLTICAERSALSAAITAGARDFKAMAIIADSDQTPAPCGACLQVLSEFCGPDFVIIYKSTKAHSVLRETTLGGLLTSPFGK